jgi:hypothetical protein
MEETFEIPVTYKNQEVLFKAHVIRYGYIHHIIGTDITIERDEEGNYRALANPQKMNDNKIEVELLRAIVGVLEAL